MSNKFNMQNVIVWIKNNVGSHFRYKKDMSIIDRYLQLQVENSLRMGWDKKDIILITNFDFEYMGVKAYKVSEICGWSSFVNKLVVVNQMIKSGVINDNFWLHDADAYQLVPFEFPSECKDIGFTRHAPGRNKPQGGSSFYRKSAFKFIDVIAEMIMLFKPEKEESFFPLFYNDCKKKLLAKYDKKIAVCTQKMAVVNNEKSKNKYKLYIDIYSKQRHCIDQYAGAFISNFSWLDWTYDLFRVAHFDRKYRVAQKPIKVAHFHLEYESCYNCFCLGQNRHGVSVIDNKLMELFKKYGFSGDKLIRR